MASFRFLALAAAVLVVLGGAPLHADEVLLKDGRSYEGKIEKETQDAVTIRTRFGVVELARAEIAEVKRGKTTRETFEERWETAKSAADYYELGQWCEEKKLKGDAKRCMKRVLDLDTDHEGARTYLGYVRYEGEWVTEEQRDERVRAREEAEMLAKGMVRHGERWVTPEDKARLDAGMVFEDGVWLTPDDLKRRSGLEPWHGEWLPRALVRSHEDADRIAERAGVEMARVAGEHVLVAGTYPPELLGTIARGLDEGRRWFHQVFGLAADDPFAGDRVPQFYVWSRDSAPYVATCDWLGSLTDTVDADWAERVKKIHGFLWWSPYCVSSARVWHRADVDVVGHCYHHAGHLLLNRVLHDGKLLPAWIDEGFAAAYEFRTHGMTTVFCVTVRPPREEKRRGPLTGAPDGGGEAGGTGGGPGGGRDGGGKPGRRGGGSEPGDAQYRFETLSFRGAGWARELREALEAGGVEAFDAIARKDYGELTVLDIAASMAIVEWLLSQEGAIARFHAVLRARAPALPLRIHPEASVRYAMYEQAFRAAVGMSCADADRAWREWFLARED